MAVLRLFNIELCYMSFYRHYIYQVPGHREVINLCSSQQYCEVIIILQMLNIQSPITGSHDSPLHSTPFSALFLLLVFLLSLSLVAFFLIFSLPPFIFSFSPLPSSFSSFSLSLAPLLPDTISQAPQRFLHTSYLWRT